MRYSLAIIALLGLTNAIQIQADPVPLTGGPDAAAEKAAEPEKKKTTKVVEANNEALKTGDDTTQEEVAKGGQKIDVSGVAEQVAAPAKKLDKDGKPIEAVPLSDDEKTRNSIVRVASTGQEAIKVNDT